MKFLSFLLLSIGLVGGVANAALLPTPESGNPKPLPDGKPPGKVLPGRDSDGGSVLPGGGNGGDGILPKPAAKQGGADMFRESSQIRLVGLVGKDTGSNVGATLEAGEPIHGAYEGNPGGKSMWWRFVARSNGHLLVSTQGSDFDTVVGVYVGDTLDGLMAVGHDNDSGPKRTSTVSIRMLAGTTYHIAVDGYNGASGNINITLTGAPDPTATSGPTNDQFEDAVQLAGNYTVDYGYNFNATVGPEDLGYSAGQTVWWTWRAPSSGRVTIRTAGSDFDTYLFVYAPMSLFSFISNDDVGRGDRSSIITTDVREGDVLDIAVDGWLMNSGYIVLTVDLQPSQEKPSNDAFGFRKGVGGRSYSEVTTNVATLWDEVGEPVHAGRLTTGSVWWTWTAPSNGVVTISARAKPSAENKAVNPLVPVVAAYRGLQLNELKTIADAADDDLDGNVEASMTVKKGEIYQFVVAAQPTPNPPYLPTPEFDFVDPNTGEFTFRVSFQDGAPAIVTQPKDAEVDAGDTATFTVEVSPKAQAPMRFRWQVRTAKNQWTNVENDAQFSGVRSETLTIQNVTEDMDGLRFRCVIQNKKGTKVSKPATLSVSESPLKAEKKKKNDKKKQSGKKKKSGENKVIGNTAPSGGKLLGN